MREERAREVGGERIQAASLVPQGLAAAGAAFLKCLGQTLNVCGLYKTEHPVAVGALGETFKSFDELLRLSPKQELTLSLVEGRWLLNELPVVDLGQAPEALERLFRGHGLHSLTFVGDVRYYEFAALCAVSARAGAAADAGRFSEALRQKGVNHIHPDAETYGRASQPSPAPAPAPTSPLPSPAAAAPAKRRVGNFSSLLRQLVEAASEDPDEQAHIYADAFGLVKQVLDRRVWEATAALQRDKQRIMSEQIRTEKVLSTVAEGKVIVDQGGRVLMMNPAAEEISGKRLSEVAGRTLSETVSGEGRMLAMSKDGVIDPRRRPSEEVSVIADPEVERALKRSLAVVSDENGRVLGTCAMLPDAQKFHEAQKLQEEFLQRMTHDLKAPLASICAALELISEKSGPKLSGEETKFLSVCVKNSQLLAEMIAKILDFSKLDGGGASVLALPVRPEALISETIDSLLPLARQHGISLQAGETPSPLPEVLADRSRAVEILINLVSNAIKSTPAGGRIAVGAAPGGEAHQGMAVFTVSDTGRGIAPESIERIFEKFFQAPADGEPREGMGLGLSIVRELVRLHGGTVWVESVPGKGAAFSFTLPLRGAK